MPRLEVKKNKVKENSRRNGDTKLSKDRKDTRTTLAQFHGGMQIWIVVQFDARETEKMIDGVWLREKEEGKHIGTASPTTETLNGIPNSTNASGRKFSSGTVVI
ncbi:unnamed protein product [Acanthocheilonema viteae]|uniref:Uncharacterized protein n=1 Tax=Acanthocheilonema viteae TaxID=6277 RepID=A0A498SB12_ACAVI|nr:unnamed protein product [Acanthocheilonema viteae]